jgi:creatinine amidohydrolase/Fe(II)-dependent formamide hydrolase-like protein
MHAYVSCRIVMIMAGIGKPNGDFTVRDDPRDATPELGKVIIENSVKVISEIVRATWNKINN